jgi:beta-glucosidase
VNEIGLDFYDRLVDALLKANITPFVTLYHWNLPQALQFPQGGWASRATVEQFAHYADRVSRQLGDRVKYWTTLNEPGVVTRNGHIWGSHMPGLTDWATGVQVGHHLLVAHGMAVLVVRTNAGPNAQVGIICEQAAAGPLADDSQDVQNAHFTEAFANRWFLDPIFLGAYPTALLESPQFVPPAIEARDFEIIKTPIDFVGINYYTRSRVSHDGIVQSFHNPNAVCTTLGWEVYPPGLTKVLRDIYVNYAPKAVYVTENGTSFDDSLPVDGIVGNSRRVAYLESHLDAAAAAFELGVPLKGYFVWSSLENFEWAPGYSRRFGLVHINFNDHTRALRQSGFYYKRKSDEERNFRH